ncbi:MAG: HIT domain-containing protein [Rhodospirillaceae bacterium]|nr:HIT domain-containing protein [Rhodospirillaceae bacterium]
MDEPFALHPRLAADTHELARWPLSRLLLMDDCRWPWLVLVPGRPGVREIHDLAPADRTLLVEEIARAGRLLQRLAAPDKINVGALGNLVPQLHVHVVARFTTDPAWPGPVWGFGTRRPYAAAALAERRDALGALLAGPDGAPP